MAKEIHYTEFVDADFTLKVEFKQIREEQCRQTQMLEKILLQLTHLASRFKQLAAVLGNQNTGESSTSVLKKRMASSDNHGRYSEHSASSSRFDALPNEFDPIGKFGSFDYEDPQTTHLYVGNLSPQVEENFLLRAEPFIMITGSGIWIRPPFPAIKGSDHKKESITIYAIGRSMRVELERTVTDAQRDEIEDMLSVLTLERNHIKEAMGSALDDADAAGEVVEALTKSLTLKETPIPTKVARLMLVSNILHNSSAPVKNAPAYRTKFESTLPDIIKSFNDLYRSITGRNTVEALKECIIKVLQVWADWYMFFEAYVKGLRVIFLRSRNSGVISFHSICGEAPELEQKSSSEDGGEGAKANQDAALTIGKGAAMKELLSLPFGELERRCRHNRLSLVGGHEMMVARLFLLKHI